MLKDISCQFMVLMVTFGNETEKAVKQLQKDSGLEVDGIIGQHTWGVLNSDFKRPEISAIYPRIFNKKRATKRRCKKSTTKIN